MTAIFEKSHLPLYERGGWGGGGGGREFGLGCTCVHVFQVYLLQKTLKLLKHATEIIRGFFQLLFDCPTASDYWGGSLNQPMLITCVLHIQPESHWEPRNEVGSLSPVEHLVGFELETWFWSQCFNPLGHSTICFIRKTKNNFILAVATFDIALFLCCT